jgi:hypothetical protein
LAGAKTPKESGEDWARKIYAIGWYIGSVVGYMGTYTRFSIGMQSPLLLGQQQSERWGLKKAKDFITGIRFKKKKKKKPQRKYRQTCA